MRLRPAVHTDVARLDAIALAAKAHWGYSPAQLEQWRPTLLTAQETIDAWPTIVAEVESVVVAFVQVNPEVSPWELTSLWVLPQFMRQGIGSALLREVTLVARSAGQRVIAIDSDPNAEPFYRSCGARVAGTVPAPIIGHASRVRPQLHLSTGEG